MIIRVAQLLFTKDLLSIITAFHCFQSIKPKQQFSPLELFQLELFQFCQVAVSVSEGIVAVTDRPWYVCCHYSQANGIYIRSLLCAQLKTSLNLIVMHVCA